MKEITEKDLVIGEVYADRKNKEDATFLRYVGSVKNKANHFEYVSGVNKYNQYYIDDVLYIGFCYNPNEIWYKND